MTDNWIDFLNDEQRSALQQAISNNDLVKKSYLKQCSLERQTAFKQYQALVESEDKPLSQDDKVEEPSLVLEKLRENHVYKKTCPRNYHNHCLKVKIESSVYEDLKLECCLPMGSWSKKEVSSHILSLEAKILNYRISRANHEENFNNFCCTIGARNHLVHNSFYGFYPSFLSPDDYSEFNGQHLLKYIKSGRRTKIQKDILSKAKNRFLAKNLSECSKFPVPTKFKRAAKKKENFTLMVPRMVPSSSAMTSSKPRGSCTTESSSPVREFKHLSGDPLESVAEAPEASGRYFRGAEHDERAKTPFVEMEHSIFGKASQYIFEDTYTKAQEANFPLQGGITEMVTSEDPVSQDFSNIHHFGGDGREEQHALDLITDTRVQSSATVKSWLERQSFSSNVQYSDKSDCSSTELKQLEDLRCASPPSERRRDISTARRKPLYIHNVLKPLNADDVLAELGLDN